MIFDCQAAGQTTRTEWSAMRNKTDKNDARGIAHVLRTGWFSPVHMKSREAHGLRALLTGCRAQLGMAEQNLDHPHIDVCLQQMRCKAVP